VPLELCLWTHDSPFQCSEMVSGSYSSGESAGSAYQDS
jgi:hypothetical protein